jgi:hypothetical protein
LIAGLLGAVIIVLVVITNREAARLDVLYCGQTNENQVVFSLINGSQLPVTYWIGLAQVKSNGVWLRPHMTPDDGVAPAPTVLMAGAQTNAVVDVPRRDAEWRLPVFWQLEGKGRSLGGIIKFNSRLLKRWWPHRQQVSPPKISMRGDEIVRIAYSVTVTNRN